MNTVLIVDNTDSDIRIMTGILLRAGYTPVIAESMESAKLEVDKLLPGAVIVLALKFRGGNATELIDWLKIGGYKFPVIAIMDNLNPMELIDVMCDWGAVNVIQRLAIDKQLLDMVSRYSKQKNKLLRKKILFTLDKVLIFDTLSR